MRKHWDGEVKIISGKVLELREKEGNVGVYTYLRIDNIIRKTCLEF